MFENFARWYTVRCNRTKGAPPAPKTLVSHLKRLHGAARLMGAQDEASFGTLMGDRQQVVLLLDKLYARQQPQTVRNVLVALRYFGAYAISQGWVQEVAIVPDDTPGNAPQKPVEVYSRAECDLLLSLARARDLRYWAFLATVIETGRRVGEVLDLQWSWLRLETEPPYFDLPTTKNKRQAYVPLTKMLREEVFVPQVMDRLKAKGTAQLTRPKEVYPFPFGYAAAVGRLKFLCDLGAVDYRGYHCFRHTKATEMLARGVPMQAVSALLGHANVATTDRIYNHATALSYAAYID